MFKSQSLLKNIHYKKTLKTPRRFNYSTKSVFRRVPKTPLFVGTVTIIGSTVLYLYYTDNDIKRAILRPHMEHHMSVIDDLSLPETVRAHSLYRLSFLTQNYVDCQSMVEKGIILSCVKAIKNTTNPNMIYHATIILANISSFESLLVNLIDSSVLLSLHEIHEKTKNLTKKDVDLQSKLILRDSILLKIIPHMNDTNLLDYVSIETINNLSKCSPISEKFCETIVRYLYRLSQSHVILFESDERNIQSFFEILKHSLIPSFSSLHSFDLNKNSKKMMSDVDEKTIKNLQNVSLSLTVIANFAMNKNNCSNPMFSTNALEVLNQIHFYENIFEETPTSNHKRSNVDDHGDVSQLFHEIELQVLRLISNLSNISDSGS
eukprot:TRINITY_DN2728_c0_g1_i1.p1 TRINITY_DN2728_c0_g1~~TRINITY_DN2728_c0_g1_i1.p1  ORF type:complete len:377 (-),score=41.86 TRINITY_DN2728_c0_g1_i1:68-1198(-)